MPLTKARWPSSRHNDNNSIMNTKRFFLAMACAAFLLVSCNEKDGGNLSTDLVTNPKSATQPSDKQPVITFDKSEHDFGTLLQGEVVSYSFHFTNTGNEPLLITDVKTSCGCTAGDFSREPVAPGKDGHVKVTYDSKGHHGMQTRMLTVISNTNPAQTILKIKGKVLTPDQY